MGAGPKAMFRNHEILTNEPNRSWVFMVFVFAVAVGTRRINRVLQNLRSFSAIHTEIIQKSLYHDKSL